mmetsp:Transcript_43377/g.114238  ORF Transcript_43377/g.114238 Transcript_43377/m.114238 type:complete len:234 (+) Transcript_43377:96-797(+)
MSIADACCSTAAFLFDICFSSSAFRFLTISSSLGALPASTLKPAGNFSSLSSMSSRKTRLQEKPWPSSSTCRRDPLWRPHCVRDQSGWSPSSSASSETSGYSGSKMQVPPKYTAGRAAPSSPCTHALTKAPIFTSPNPLTTTRAVRPLHTKHSEFGFNSVLGCKIFFREGSGNLTHTVRPRDSRMVVFAANASNVWINCTTSRPATMALVLATAGMMAPAMDCASHLDSRPMR